MGSKAYQLLQKILRPVSSMSEKYSVLIDERMSCSGVIPLTVSDPRALNQDQSTKFDSSYTDLWDASNRLCCPIEESVLCTEKHQQRLSSFCFTDKSSNDNNASTNMHSSRFCPVLVLKRENLMDSVTRWSIILPLSWVKAFWVPLVSLGAQAIGLRERSWVACEARIPTFPSEYPECTSYSSLMEAEAAIDKEAALRPISVRPFSIPIPPPWNCSYLNRLMPRTRSSGALSNKSVADSDMSDTTSKRTTKGQKNKKITDYEDLSYEQIPKAFGSSDAALENILDEAQLDPVEEENIAENPDSMEEDTTTMVSQINLAASKTPVRMMLSRNVEAQSRQLLESINQTKASSSIAITRQSDEDLISAVVDETYAKFKKTNLPLSHEEAQMVTEQLILNRNLGEETIKWFVNGFRKGKQSAEEARDFEITKALRKIDAQESKLSGHIKELVGLKER